MPCIWLGHIGEYHLRPSRLGANTTFPRRPAASGDQDGIGPQSLRTQTVFPNMSSPDAWYSSILDTVPSTIHWKFHIVIFSIEKGIYLINIHCVGKKKESPLIGRQNCELTFRSKEARMWGEDLKVKAGFSRGSTNVCFTAFQNLTGWEERKKYLNTGMPIFNTLFKVNKY